MRSYNYDLGIITVKQSPATLAREDKCTPFLMCEWRHADSTDTLARQGEEERDVEDEERYFISCDGSKKGDEAGYAVVVRLSLIHI